ncbi:flavoprotein [Actinokineospora inagensis]|uniref:flavoprotein n=1 Tax=Actinokineospora inagensis TaxID=103730 RepID=UPI00040C5F18|nr:flavoprotein [Actinokineospora inagensis]
MAERVLYLVGCAAPPVRDLGTFVALLQARGWDVCVIATPTAAGWVDGDALAVQTGYPVLSAARRPDVVGGLPRADVVVVAPATFNTVNKWAAGISDTLALGVLNEAIGLRLPVYVAPYAKATLAAHPAFGESLTKLARWGVTVLPNELIRPVEGQSFRWARLLDSIPG